MKRIITSLGTFASIISLAFAPGILCLSRIIIAFVGIVCFIVLLVDDVKNQTENEKVCHSDSEIKATMKELIKSQGRVCVMSGDLSWVDDDIEKSIIQKKNSVRIYAEKEIELTKRLCSAGVQIKYYGNLGFEPKTRFTVLRYNRSNPQVAIANTEHSIRKKGKFKHVIYETRDNSCKQDKWINSLAVDMITLCNIVFKEGEDIAKDSSKEAK